MGALVNGQWKAEESSEDPEDTQFDGWIASTKEDTAAGKVSFPAIPEHYCLYAAWACPFVHRALLARSVMGLDPELEVIFMADIKRHAGWETTDVSDLTFGKSKLYQVITEMELGYTGRASVPTLYDKVSKQIVSNSSTDISAMLLTGFAWGDCPNLREASKTDAIDASNARIHETVNLGVYREGFDQSQSEYEEAIDDLFTALDAFDLTLQLQPYLHGATLSESDLWLFATLIRFDSIYSILFKCTRRRIHDYPGLSKHLRSLANHSSFASATNLTRAKAYYF